jgi:hypothetical protein
MAPVVALSRDCIEMGNRLRAAFFLIDDRTDA